MFILPAISLAVPPADEKGLNGIIGNLTELFGNAYALILVAIGLAFAWGILKFVFKSGSDQEEGKTMMIWSIVAITVLASVYGIVKIVQDTVGVKSETNTTFPNLPTPSS